MWVDALTEMKEYIRSLVDERTDVTLQFLQFGLAIHCTYTLPSGSWNIEISAHIPWHAMKSGDPGIILIKKEISRTLERLEREKTRMLMEDLARDAEAIRSEQD